MMEAARGDPARSGGMLTVNPPRAEAFFKEINGLQEPLMIEWE
jgi:hypothetical protein